MQKISLSLVGLALIIGGSACNPLASAPTAAPISTFTPPPSATLPAPLATPTPMRLSTELLKNAEYLLPTYQQTVRLVDGHYAADALSVTLLEPMAWGDLNGDGVEDAAVLLAENGGGSGTFVSVVALLNQADTAAQAGAALIDDRPLISAINIQDQRITVEATIHGINDPFCCPTFPVTETYQLHGNALTLMRFASQTPNGLLRAITLQSPPAGTVVEGSVQVTGQVTVAPFENSLGYRLLDLQGNELAVGPVSVTAQEMGGPGTFDAAIALPALPAGTTFRLTLSDLSAADGSVLAMDSVVLVMK